MQPSELIPDNNIVIEQASPDYFWKAWIIWSSSAVFVLFQFFLQLSSGVIVEDLMRSFAINALGAGILSSTFYYVYVLLQTPAGVLIDRYGPRRLLSGGAVICAIGCWLFSIAHSMLIAEIGRILMGGGSAFAFVGSLYLISQWFPANKFAYMVGIAETVGTLGVLVGDMFLAAVLQTYGWRNCMWIAAIISVMICFLCGLIIRDRPFQNENLILRPAKNHFWSDAFALIKNPQAWLNGFYSGLQFAIVTVFVALWGIPFLVKAHTLSIPMATLLSSMLFVGLAIGCPVVGKLSIHIRRRRLFLMNCSLANALLIIIILFFTHLSFFIVSLLMFTVGLLCSSYVLNFAIANEIAPPHATSTSMGFANTLSVITAPLLQPVVGALLNLMSRVQGHPIGVKNYTVFDYQIALLVLPLCLIIAALCAYFLKEKINVNE